MLITTEIETDSELCNEDSFQRHHTHHLDHVRNKHEKLDGKSEGICFTPFMLKMKRIFEITRANFEKILFIHFYQHKLTSL